MTRHKDQKVCITGIGIVSSLADGVEAHKNLLFDKDQVRVVLNDTWFSPYTIHPLVDIDFSTQIPKRSDQRQMELWQKIGTYAAGLAIEDAGLTGKQEYLEKLSLLVAAGSGERDIDVDRKVLDYLILNKSRNICPNEVLMGSLRPTLFLAQLSNLLAGNISIVHNVTGASRTYMGEEMAGIAAINDAFRRIQRGQGDLFLVGAANQAKREDLLLNYELGHFLWSKPYQPVWKRLMQGGMILGSMGCFLVLESEEHAQKRGAKIYAILGDVKADRKARKPGDLFSSLSNLYENMQISDTQDKLPVLSGASGAEPALNEELSFLEDLKAREKISAIRGISSLFGHGVEAQFPLAIALAALSVSEQKYYCAFDAGGDKLPICDRHSSLLDYEQDWRGPLNNILVTCVGHWRGESLALIEKSYV